MSRHSSNSIGPILTLVLALICGLGCSCRPTGTALSTDPGVVWSIETKKGHQIFLAGSLHLLRKKDHPLPRTLFDALDRSQRLITESGGGEDSAAEVKQIVEKFGKLPQGSHLSDTVSEEAKLALNAHYQENPGTKKAMEDSRAWLASIQVAMTSYRASGTKKAHGVEATLLAIANRDRLSVGQLETPSEQLGALASLSPETQEALLVQALEESDDMDARYQPVKEAWRKGDLKTIREHFERELDPRFAPLQKAVLHDRNIRFASSIVQMVEDTEENILVLVGVGHLVGDWGIPALLRKQGLTLTRVTRLAE